ncbi:MAG: hypothetical protein IJJ99_08180, partial [Oscillospiraceae bacterium]|nr:hypothetical protein [Oscillospiraceae bacterium]
SGSVTPTEPTTAPTEPTTAPTQPTTAPTEPTTAPTEPTTAPTEPVGDGSFVLSGSIKNGDQVVIYNPGHGMAIKDENDNHWYLVPQAITPVNNKIANPDASIVWTVVDNGNGTYSFTNGSDKIVMWVSGNYFELTNDASHSGANGNWVVTWAADGLAYIKHESFSNNYGSAYIECYYNANKDVTNISGYSTSDPTAKSNDFGFQFFVKSGSTTPTEPTTAPTQPTTAPTEPTTAPTQPTVAPTEPTFPPATGNYAKVTGEQSDWSGKYLIAYESGDGSAIVYCGSDAAGDTITAAVSAGEIVYQNGMAVVTVKKCGSGYSMQLADGTYLDSKPLDGNGNEVNGIVLSENEAELTIRYGDGSTDVVAATGSVLRYNSTEGQARFRFYKSATYTNQKPIQLYKQTEEPIDPTQPTTAPTEPTTAPTQPTVAPTEPAGVPIEEGDCVVIYNAVNGVIIGYNEDTDYDESTGNYTYFNITTETAAVSGTTLKALFENAGTFYVIANADGTYAFLDQYDYDQSEDPENPTAYFITAEAPNTYYDSSAEYAAFELIPVEGGYLLKNVADNSYYAIENGVVVAKDLVEGDPNFIFQFAIWDGTTEGENTIVCTLTENGSVTPTEPTTAPTEPTTAPTEPTTAPTQPTTAPSGNEYVLTTSLKDGDQVI